MPLLYKKLLCVRRWSDAGPAGMVRCCQIQCPEPKTGQQKVQFYYEDDPLCPSSYIIYLWAPPTLDWGKDADSCTSQVGITKAHCNKKNHYTSCKKYASLASNALYLIFYELADVSWLIWQLFGCFHSLIFFFPQFNTLRVPSYSTVGLILFFANIYVYSIFTKYQYFAACQNSNLTTFSRKYIRSILCLSIQYVA